MIFYDSHGAPWQTCGPDNEGAVAFGPTGIACPAPAGTPMWLKAKALGRLVAGEVPGVDWDTLAPAGDVTITLPHTDVQAIADRIRGLQGQPDWSAIDLDDAAEPLRWALEHLSAETAILDVRRAPRQDRQPSQSPHATKVLEGTPSWEKLYRSTAAERDRLAEQVAANRGRYESARRERDTMAAVIRGVAQNFRRLGQDREADGLLALAGLGT